MEKGPQGRRRGRGARERILSASQQLFRDQGINRTGMDQLCAVAQVSKRTAYQHFADKDELVAEYLRRFDPGVMAAVFDRTDLTPRERLLAAFEVPATGTQDITPMCPYIAASVEIHDPQHPASPIRTRLQESLRRAARRNRPRSRRRQPRTARRATGAAPRRRLGPHPGPQHRILPHRRRHRRRPHRQRHPRDSPRECKYNSRVARGENPSGYPAQDGQVQPGTARRAALRLVAGALPALLRRRGSGKLCPLSGAMSCEGLGEPVGVAWVLAPSIGKRSCGQQAFRSLFHRFPIRAP